MTEARLSGVIAAIATAVDENGEPDCARSTVAETIKALEDAGLLSWVNRITRIRERCEDLFGRFGTRLRVIRTSNGYQFHDPKAAVSRGYASKSDFQSGTPIQDSSLLTETPQTRKFDPDNPLDQALISLGKHIGVHLEVKE